MKRSPLNRGTKGFKAERKPLKRSPLKKQSSRKLTGRQKLDRAVQKIGYRNYTAYLDSPHWEGFRKRYRERWPSARCLGCRSLKYQLHHIRYGRLGREVLKDCIPLCHVCHFVLHRAHKSLKLTLTQFVPALMSAFGLSEAEVKSRLSGYSKL